MTCSEGSDCRGADTAGFKIEGSELPICYFYDYSIWNQGGGGNITFAHQPATLSCLTNSAAARHYKTNTELHLLNRSKALFRVILVCNTTHALT